MRVNKVSSESVYIRVNDLVIADAHRLVQARQMIWSLIQPTVDLQFVPQLSLAPWFLPISRA